MNDAPEFLYAGVGRTVVAMERLSGDRVWGTKLPFMGGHISMILPHEDRIYVGRRSSVSCLDRATGRFLWKRDLGELRPCASVHIRDGSAAGCFRSCGEQQGQQKQW